MCGICGVFDRNKRHGVDGMVAAMHHRGPDDSWIFQDGPVTLGVTRLAIIDTTAGGRQPMCNEDRSIWIVYNGETYNFREERKLLESKGYSFKSSSDTEVVLRMYEEYGDDFLLRMRGMFALAIYDKRPGPNRERLLLARDHLGIKPLLYARVGSAFVFGSEIKAILASGLVQKLIDPEALRLLMAQGSIPQPMTAISGVKMLLPGHRLVVQAGRESIERFWGLGLNRFVGYRARPYEQLVRELRSSLEESVRMQMVSDVPIGAFLSGGVDSATLVALMARMSAVKVKTFSVGFAAEGSYIDETDDAHAVAQFIGTDHSRVLVTGQDVRDRISNIAASLDQPSVDGVNAYFVSMAASGGVTVAISGTGGDELFGGYPWFRNMALAVRRGWLSAVNGLVGDIARCGIFDPILEGRWGKLLDKVRGQSLFLPYYARQHQVFGAHGAARILSAELKSLSQIRLPPETVAAMADELPEASPVDRVTALCLRGYTQNQLLRDIDAVSMSHSLEVRVPYLDPKVVDLALSLPVSAKLGDGAFASGAANSTYRETGLKRILVDASRGLVPNNIDLQQKRGFAMPFDSWMRGPLREVVEDTLSPSSVSNRGFFDVKAVLSYYERFFAQASSWVFLWLLMITELWCREVLDVAPTPQSTSKLASDALRIQ